MPAFRQSYNESYNAARTGGERDKAEHPSARTAESAIVVDPQRLVSAYRANEVAADMAYKGKILQITGVVESINKDFLDEPYIVIGGHFQGLSGIQCCFTKADEPALSGLYKGQQVVITGRCSGMIMLSVFLKNCSVETPEMNEARKEAQLRMQIAKEVGANLNASGGIDGTPAQGSDFAIKYVERTGKPFTMIFNDVSGKAVVTKKFEMEDGKVVARDVDPNAHEDQINNAVPQEPTETQAEKE
jgi:hypothetical protein